MPKLPNRLARLLIGCLLALSSTLPGAAQDYYSNADLDTLVGPIALYPDPLLSNVIKASTFPDQVEQAAKTQTEDAGWDDSVKAVHAAPDAMQMMGANPEWTQSLGWAASNQLPDLMDAVQRFRYRAQQAGNLEFGEQAQVIQEGTTIRIEQADPEVIYVPTYNPEDVDDDNFGEGLFFGAAVATSAYMWTNMFHWNNCAFYNRPYGYRPPAGYYRPYGWQGTGVYNGAYANRIGNTNLARGNVQINNNVNFNNRTRNGATRINTGNINTGNRNRVNTGNNRVGSGNSRTNTGGNTRVNAPRGQGQSPVTGNRDFTRPGNNNRTLARPEAPTRVGRPNMPTTRPAMPSTRPAASTRASNPSRTTSRRSSSPNIGSYSSSGQSVRQSNRGAQSRGSRSVSSGARYSGGGRSGGGRSGGGRRR